MNLFNKSDQNGAPNDKATVVNSKPATFADHAVRPSGPDRQPSGRPRPPSRCSMTSRALPSDWPVSLWAYDAPLASERRSWAGSESCVATLSRIRPRASSACVIWSFVVMPCSPLSYGFLPMPWSRAGRPCRLHIDYVELLFRPLVRSSSPSTSVAYLAFPRDAQRLEPNPPLTETWSCHSRAVPARASAVCLAGGTRYTPGIYQCRCTLLLTRTCRASRCG